MALYIILPPVNKNAPAPPLRDTRVECYTAPPPPTLNPKVAAERCAFLVGNSGATFHVLCVTGSNVFLFFFHCIKAPPPPPLCLTFETRYQSNPTHDPEHKVRSSKF